MLDAFQEVFLSVGVCLGTFFAYGSYSDRKQPVIGNAFLICIFDFMMSVVASILAWSTSGFLRAKDDPAYAQMNSVGFAFIAMPRLADFMGEEGQLWLCLFMAYLALSGLDSSFSYIEGLVANIVDATKLNRWLVSFIVCICGVGLTAIFTSNIGWILLDIVEHYLTTQIIPAVGLF